MIVSVPEGKDKPYQCSEGFFIRMGANSQKMGRDHLVDFLQAEGKLRHVGKLNTRVIYFFFKGHRIVAVHGIRTKSTKILKKDHQVAHERMRDWLKRIKA